MSCAQTQSNRIWLHGFIRYSMITSSNDLLTPLNKSPVQQRLSEILSRLLVYSLAKLFWCVILYVSLSLSSSSSESRSQARQQWQLYERHSCFCWLTKKMFPCLLINPCHKRRRVLPLTSLFDAMMPFLFLSLSLLDHAERKLQCEDTRLRQAACH